jgi:hypothetical protein
LLFGGWTGVSCCWGDTWVWDGTNWTQKFPTNSPEARASSAMALDSTHGQVVLFGGWVFGYSYVVYGDTWTWDGINWTQKFPANSPSPRYGHTMTVDSSGRLVMFGGRGVGGVLGETWVWDGTNWTQKFPANSPAPRSGHAMASDGTGKVVLFGGLDANNALLGDTWVWDGTNWTQQTSTQNPSARFAAVMASSLRNQVVLFGGQGSGCCSVLGDTWLWGRSLR